MDLLNTVKSRYTTKAYDPEKKIPQEKFNKLLEIFSVHDKFHRTLILSGFCLLKIAKISLNSSFFPKPIKR